jgi:hypothetical protein
MSPQAKVGALAAAEVSSLLLPRQEVNFDATASPRTPIAGHFFDDSPVASGSFMMGAVDSGVGSTKNAPSGTHLANELKGMRVFLGGSYSEKEVIAFGGILEDSQLKVRSSCRIRAHPNADASQMDRAQQQAAARDPLSFSGTKHLNKFSLAFFSHDQVVN